MKKVIGIVAGALVLVGFIGWFIGSSNPESPAGYVGYLTQGAVFGKTKFYGLQTGPSSPGRTWLLSTTNVSITPYTYTEDFTGENSVLSKDNLKIGFRVHVVWKVQPDRVKEFVEKYSTLTNDDKASNKVVEVAYTNFLKEPLRTYARDEIQRLDGLEIKDKITPVGEAVFTRVKTLTQNTPFEVASVVVGNIQYPAEVADAVAKKMAMTQVLEQKATELKIEAQTKAMRIVQAEGIAKAMEIIQAKLTAQYLQHEAIEAQRAMVNSPNHTTIYIPVGPMGVPLVGTFDTTSGKPQSTQK
ncbi:MAG: SPFH domain-containing protein [Candidatus Sungbacteria bacterium]|nr:SPFH domain-containing protein [Candidatus Sungbacteria bacterium]